MQNPKKMALSLIQKEKNSAAPDSLHLFRILATTLKWGVKKISHSCRANSAYLYGLFP
jgi:hypothetical protein